MKKSHKQSAVAFLKAASSGQVREAYDRYIGPAFKHHNPFFKGDAASLMEGMEQNAKQNPNKTLEVHAAIEEGDQVVVFSHVRQKPEERGWAVVHIFRFEDGRIAELWDMGQAVPETSVNENGMF